jgi:hypothetical protein
VKAFCQQGQFVAYSLASLKEGKSDSARMEEERPMSSALPLEKKSNLGPTDATDGDISTFLKRRITVGG